MADGFNAQLIDVIPVANTLGEAVLWDDRDARLWWTDIHEKLLYRYTPRTAGLERFELPERLGSFGLVEGSEEIIAAFESGFALYRPETGDLVWLERPAHRAANMRFNDGRVDRLGRFWAGSMMEGQGEPEGQLYCLNRGHCQAHLSGVAIANSLCFSPDGTRLYFADTPHRALWSFELDPVHGTLSNRRLLAHTPEGSYPDGSNIDASGRLWTAHWGGGCVTCYAPDGGEMGRIELPVTQPTCVAFGGEHLDVLYVTSARQDLASAALALQPQAGHVFAYQLDCRGIAEPRYVP